MAKRRFVATTRRAGTVEVDEGATLGATAGVDLRRQNGNIITEAEIDAGGGSVTSVGLAMPSIFGVTGTPVTTAGTLTATLQNQTANIVFSGPASGSAAPAFRALVSDDVPALDAGKIISGQFPIARLASGTPTGSKFVRDDGTLAAPSAGAITSATAALGADTQLPTSNVWVDGPSISLAAGTWLVSAHGTFTRTATTALTYFMRITDGTTHHASSQQFQASVANHSTGIKICAIVTLASTTTIKIQATTNAGATTNLMKAALTANGSGNNATMINAIKLS